MHDTYGAAGEIGARLDYAARYAADLRYDHAIDFREAVTDLPARPGTIR